MIYNISNQKPFVLSVSVLCLCKIIFAAKIGLTRCIHVHSTLFLAYSC